jgi:hypothetical protein
MRVDEMIIHAMCVEKVSVPINAGAKGLHVFVLTP